MGPTMVQVAPLIEASPVTDFARAFTAEAIRAVLDSRIPLPPAVGDNLQSIRQFLDQIPAVFNQVLQFMCFHDFSILPVLLDFMVYSKLIIESHIAYVCLIQSESQYY
jgi:hypothetical protein